MASLPGWMILLLDRINWGCSTSPWFVELADEKKVLSRGQKIILDLWPFIRELPANIACVREKLPEHMSAAKSLLGRLADDELYYQNLFKQQFKLAGLTESDLDSFQPAEKTAHICRVMKRLCQTSNYADGIYAIVAAELSATMYCRSSLPSYENYFASHPADYGPETIDAGLAWLRLHAKTHTRHAIWMKRMLEDLEESAGNEVPQAAEEILNAVFRLWDCPLAELATPH